MSRLARGRRAAALVVLAALAPGCEGCHSPAPASEAPAAGEPDASSSTRRVGVKVPMPPGWSAQVTPEGSFQFGPPDHPVLRVDLRSGQGAAMPGAAALSQSLDKAFAGFERSSERREEGEDVVLVHVVLTARLADGGVGHAEPALFGARRVERDLLLCATFPGVTADEAREAADACRGIELQPRH